MNGKTFTPFLFLLAGALAGGQVLAQHPVGIFEDHVDIGNPKVSGSASYDEATQTYNIAGGGSNIWFNRDEVHFSYKQIKGGFILPAAFAFKGDPPGPITPHDIPLYI